MASPTPESPFEVVEKLPSPSPHLHRFHARERESGKEVELRVCRNQEEATWLRAFTLELRDLSALDHPAFLPVLSRGVFADRGHYAVPLRLDPHLGQVVEREELGVEARVGIVTFLLSALVHAHQHDTTTGLLHPPMIALSRVQGLPYFIHHRSSVDAFDGVLEDRLPDDCQPGLELTPRANLFLWGRLSFWLLSRGEYPFPRTGGPVRRKAVRTLDPRIPTEVAEVVDACLDWSAEARPESAREAHEVVLTAGVARPVSPAGLPAPESHGLNILDSTEFDLPRARPGRAAGLGTSVTLGAVTLEPEEAKDRGPSAEGRGLRMMAAAALVLGALAVGMALDDTAPPPPSSPPPGTRRTVGSTERKPLAPRPELVEVSEVERQRSLSDPRVRQFLSGRETTPETFRQRWQSLIRLGMRRRIPGVGIDLERIEQLKDVFRTDPRAACEELDFYRRSVTRAVGFVPPAEGGPRERAAGG